MEPILELTHITKRFGTFTANDDINLTIYKGEVHSLIGENGAGKTTLMNILYGLYRPTSGTIRLNNQEIEPKSPKQMLNAGIAMVHQHFMLVPTLTVADNVILGMMRPFHPKLSTVAEKIKQLSESLGFQIDPMEKISNLTVGARQRVEIIKALYRNIKVLILDEPTAVLTPNETDELLVMLRKLAKNGISILFISHKFDEVMTVSDRITVIRRGKIIDTREKQACEPQMLARMMTGREVTLSVQKEAFLGEPCPRLTVRELSVSGSDKRKSLNEISFSVQAGEVLAIAGIDGNGQIELLHALAGYKKITSGKIFIGEQDVTGWTPKRILERQVGYIPSDRQEEGLILGMSISENLLLECYTEAPLSRHGLLKRREIATFSNDILSEYDIRAESAQQTVQSLSGGNQQKVVIARAMLKNPQILLASYPTRGLDIGAIEFIHTMINRQRARGCAVILFSNELDEVLALGDRIGVMFEGSLSKIYERELLNKQLIGLLMAGKDIS